MYMYYYNTCNKHVIKLVILFLHEIINVKKFISILIRSDNVLVHYDPYAVICMCMT